VPHASACSGTVCNSTSGTIDSNLTMFAGHMLKVFGRYDSGWVYFNRTRDLAAYICEGH
jgi:hypothetical protein